MTFSFLTGEVSFISVSLIIALGATPGENDLVAIRALTCNTEYIQFISTTASEI